MEKDLSKDWPEVTVVSTTGLLEERPMSMYTENISDKNCFSRDNLSDCGRRC